MADNILSIVIPTYNEKENITPLVERLHRALAGRPYEIVFVDDNSRDGTAEVASGLSSRYPVRVIVRTTERGLASAVVHGFRNTTSAIIAVMDADLQHPPEIIAGLLKSIEDGSDLAIGSRYVRGGSCEGWGLVRRIISRGAIFLSHLLLPRTRGIHDPMAGLFMLRRPVIAGADLKPTGYKILLEILIAGHFNKVAEVPYAFKIREKGKSKLSSRQQIDYLKHLYSLMKRSGELIRFLKFCLVGASGVGVNFGIFWALTRFGGLSAHDTLFSLTLGGRAIDITKDFLAQAIAIEASIVSNFTLNDVFTFRDRRASGGRYPSRFLKFNAVSLAGAGVQILVYALLFHAFGVHDLLSTLVGIAVATIWNYMLNTLWTWK